MGPAVKAMAVEKSLLELQPLNSLAALAEGREQAVEPRVMAKVISKRARCSGVQHTGKLRHKDFKFESSLDSAVV